MSYIYEILTDSTPEGLQQQVQDKVDDGYSLLSSIVVTSVHDTINGNINLYVREIYKST